MCFQYLQCYNRKGLTSVNLSLEFILEHPLIPLIILNSYIADLYYFIIVLKFQLEVTLIGIPLVWTAIHL